MTIVFHARPYGRFKEIKSSLRRKKLHRTNQGSNFFGGSLSNRDNVGAPIQFRISCAEIMYQMYGFISRWCSSASSLRGCIERNNTNIITAQPANRDIIELFLKKTLIEGFSSVNTGVAFDTEILLPSLSSKDNSQLNVDESFQIQKRTDLKVGDRLQSRNDSSYNAYQEIRKILKMDQNNQ